MISIKKPAEIKYLHEILDETDSYLKRHHCPSDFVFEADLVIEELFTNTCYYAYDGSEKEQTCEFHLEIDENNLLIQRIDLGKPFNPLTIADPDVDQNFRERRVGGLGMYLVKHFCSRIEYSYRNNQNILTLYRTIPINTI
jgi:sigma-B regulation protein RsbU (phosphoserine phosphatase)